MRSSMRKRFVVHVCAAFMHIACHQDAETTYFNESAAQAKEAVDTVLQQYHDVLQKLDEDEVRTCCFPDFLEIETHCISQRGKLQRSMGMKMEQLKAEAEALDHLHA